MIFSFPVSFPRDDHPSTFGTASFVRKCVVLGVRTTFFGDGNACHILGCSCSNKGFKEGVNRHIWGVLSSFMTFAGVKFRTTGNILNLSKGKFIFQPSIFEGQTVKFSGN